MRFALTGRLKSLPQLGILFLDQEWALRFWGLSGRAFGRAIDLGVIRLVWLHTSLAGRLTGR